jgi:hypothetical protein
MSENQLSCVCACRHRYVVLAFLGVYAASSLVVDQCLGTVCWSHCQGINDPQEWMTGICGDLLV